MLDLKKSSRISINENHFSTRHRQTRCDKKPANGGDDVLEDLKQAFFLPERAVDARMLLNRLVQNIQHGLVIFGLHVHNALHLLKAKRQKEKERKPTP